MCATSDDKAPARPQGWTRRAARWVRGVLWAARGHDKWHAPAWPLSPALHPGCLAATAVLAINDWLLKPSALSAAVTGKLSDVAGMIVAPLWLATALGLLWPLSRRVVALGIFGVGAMFTAIKTSAPAAHAMESALALATDAIGLSPPLIVVDLTDLLALPALLVAWWIACDDISRVPLGAMRRAQRALRRREDIAHAVGASELIACGARREDVTQLVAAIARLQRADAHGAALIEGALEKLARL